MKTETQNIKQKSYFHQSIWGEDGWMGQNEGLIHKKVYKNVLLDPTLTFTDLSVYMAILYYSSITKGYYQKISSENIKDIIGINKDVQSPSIKKLEEKGVIGVRRNRFESKFCIIEMDSQYLPLFTSQFKGLKTDNKLYLRRLKGIFLSSGNESIPTYNTCKKNMHGKLTRPEYNRMKQVYNEIEDRENKDFNNYMLLGKEFKKQNFKVDLEVLDSIEDQLKQLLEEPT